MSGLPLRWPPASRGFTPLAHIKTGAEPSPASSCLPELPCPKAEMEHRSAAQTNGFTAIDPFSLEIEVMPQPRVPKRRLTIPSILARKTACVDVTKPRRANPGALQAPGTGCAGTLQFRRGRLRERS